MHGSLLFLAGTWFDLALFGPIGWGPWRKGWKPESAADRRSREAVGRDVARHFSDVGA